MNKRFIATAAGSITRLKYWQWQSGGGGDVVLSMASLMWMQRRGQVDLNKHLVLRPQGEASEVETRLSAGINLLQEEQSDGIAGRAAHQHSRVKTREVEAPRGCWEIPAMPSTSSGLRSSGGSGWRGAFL